MSAAVRPMAITPGRALRLLPGLVLLRVRQVRPARTARSSTSSTCRSARAKGCRAPTYLLDSAHHGLAMNPRGHEALRRRDDVGLRRDRHPQAVRAAAHGAVGRVPYWSQSSDGRQVLLRLGRRRRPGVGDLLQDRRARSPGSRSATIRSGCAPASSAAPSCGYSPISPRSARSCCAAAAAVPAPTSCAGRAAPSATARGTRGSRWRR